MVGMLFKKKKAQSSGISTFGKIVIVLLLIGFGIWLITRMRASTEDATKMSVCGGAKFGQTEGRCIPESYFCESKIKGLGCSEPGKPICCFDKIAFTFEESKSMFVNQLPGQLRQCKDDPSQCPAATETLRNLLMYTKDTGEGRVFVSVERSTSDLTTLRLHKRETFWNFASGWPDVQGDIAYLADFCILKAGKKDGDEKTYIKNAQFIVVIGKEKEGLLVGKFTGAVRSSGPVDLLGNFVSLRHEKENDAKSPLCIYFAS